MAEIKLNAKIREELGKNKVNKLRKEKDIPAVVYGQNFEPVHVSVIEKELDKAYQAAGTSVIIDLVIDGKNTPVLFKEIQRHPYKNQYTHIDFYKVNMSETLKVNVPVVLEGRDEIRLQPSVLNQNLTEITVECLPTDIPQSAVANVVEMQYGDTILVKDLDIFENKKLTILVDAEELVASLVEPKEESADEEEAATEVPTVDETEKADEE